MLILIFHFSKFDKSVGIGTCYLLFNNGLRVNKLYAYFFILHNIHTNRATGLNYVLRVLFSLNKILKYIYIYI